jgi:class I fructose-bisphosphate aldolase
MNLSRLDSFNIGKKTRLYRMMYEYGPGNGKLLILPIDQGLEHGPVDFFSNPPSKDPEFQFELAIKGGYSAIAVHYGLARRYYWKYAGKIPLILKINGKTGIPSDDEALSPLTGTVEDAIRLGADAIGYTVYVGSPKQYEDINQFQKIRAEADRYGIPVIVWAYPRGLAVEKKGGKDSFYAIDYAARTALELGADVVKINLPEKTSSDSPSPYDTMNLSVGEMAKQVVESAGKALVLFSGGSKLGDEDLLKKVKICMEAGAVGLIFGRNMWQRPMDEAVKMTEKVKGLMS